MVGALICFAITPALARLTRIPFAIIAAPLVLIMVVGAYQSTSTIGDIFMLFALGGLGWLMKHGGWPRAPALVGFVLSGPMEQYFWLTNQIHGWSWLMRPGVLVIGSIIVIPLLLSAYRWYRARHQSEDAVKDDVPPPPVETSTSSVGVALVLAVIVAVMFVYAVWEMQSFNPVSRLMPALAIVPGLPLALWLVFRGVREYQNDFANDGAELWILLTLIVYAIAVWAIGLSLPTIALIAWMLLGRAKMRLLTGAIYCAIVFAIVWILFDLLRGDAPSGALISLF